MPPHIDVDDIVSGLKRYNQKYEPMKGLMYQQQKIREYCRTITNITGEYPTLFSIQKESVVKGFTGEWNPAGKTKISKQAVPSRHFQVNYPIKPAEVISTYVADVLYSEDKSLENQTISQYIINNELLPKVIEDNERLLIKGTYDAANVADFPIDGISTLLTAGTGAAGNMYRIPLTTPTAATALQTIEDFTDKLPEKVRPYIKYIFVSTKFLRWYKKDDRAEHSRDVDYQKAKRIYTYEDGFELVALPFLPDNMIFATVDKNLLFLQDVISQPRITDIQKVDYEIKIFMEYHMGIGFAIDQLVFVADYTGATEGLRVDNALFYSTT
jgi:hypothetical protein